MNALRTSGLPDRPSSCMQAEPGMAIEHLVKNIFWAARSDIYLQT